MSSLIDTLVNYKYLNETQEEINGKWYIAKPIPYFSFSWNRTKDAWRVFIGKAHAYHYKKDERRN